MLQKQLSPTEGNSRRLDFWANKNFPNKMSYLLKMFLTIFICLCLWVNTCVCEGTVEVEGQLEDSVPSLHHVRLRAMSRFVRKHYKQRWLDRHWRQMTQAVLKRVNYLHGSQSSLEGPPVWSQPQKRKAKFLVWDPDILFFLSSKHSFSILQRLQIYASYNPGFPSGFLIIYQMKSYFNYS